MAVHHVVGVVVLEKTTLGQARDVSAIAVVAEVLLG